MEPDWERDFKDIVSRIKPGEIEDPEVGISLEEINKTIIFLTETAMFLSRFVARYIDDEETDFPDELVNLIPTLQTMCNEMSTTLLDEEGDDDDVCQCEQCQMEREDEDDDDE